MQDRTFSGDWQLKIGIYVYCNPFELAVLVAMETQPAIENALPNNDII